MYEIVRFCLYCFVFSLGWVYDFFVCCVYFICCWCFIKRKVVGRMDFLGIFVDGNMLQTFCNMFLVVFALDFISNLAQILRMK